MMKVSLVIPVYNEAGHLAEFLRQVDTLSLDGVAKELVIIDDCSKDESRAILESFTFSSVVQIHFQEKNEGKGAAIRKGVELATGDIIGIQDADFEYSMDDISGIIAPLVAGKADVVFGSRFKATVVQVHRTFHYLVNRLLTTLSNLCSGLYLTDMETCYKFFRADVIKNIKLESNRFGFEPEVTAKIAGLKLKIIEVPIWYFPRNYLEGKKITWKDGIAALGHIITFNFLRKPQDYLLPSLPKQYIPQGRQWL
jgi:glycosyltransferase involved in cell wall biosynthesis